MAKKRITKEIKIAVFASMFKESDKGCVLLVASVFERLLENIHEAASAIALTSVNAPKGFFGEKLVNNRGPLSDFSSKINMAFGYGFIPLDLHNALHVIRELRNEAAHCYFDFSLNDPGVRTHLKKLAGLDNKIDEERAMKFEDYVPKLTDDNDLKFHLMLRTHVIVSELQDIHRAQLERLIKEREKTQPTHNSDDLTAL